MKLIVLSLTTSALLSVSGAGFASDAADTADAAAQGEEIESPDAEAPAEEILIHLQVPLMSPQFSTTPVALVNEEPITVKSLTKRIRAMHMGKEQGATSIHKNYANLLERLITVKLIVQEALNIGLDELPEVQTQLDNYSNQLLMASVMNPQMVAIEPDPSELEKLYKKMSRELRMTALTFTREEEALAFQKELETRSDFKDLARLYVEAGRADGAIDDTEYMKLKELRPQIAQAAFEMKPNSVSKIFSAPEGFLIFYVYDDRPYEDAGVREEARRMLREPLMRDRADEYIAELIDKYATIDRDLLDKVDFEREKRGFLFFRKEIPADFERLMKDERVLATIHSDEPVTVTVGDLASKLEERFFHGIEKAAEKRKLNREKWRILREILFQRVVVLEAHSQGQHETEEYLENMGDFSDSLLFNTFVNKVIAPDVELNEAEVREYYDEHIADYSSPPMYRLNGLAFSSQSHAKSALEKLHKGADFKWVSANSPGLVDREAKGALLFDNSLLSLTALPDDLQKSLTKAQQGDSLLYDVPDGFHYIVNVETIFPAKPQPYAQARAEIAKHLFDGRIRDLVDHWSRELRDAYETRIFITDLED